MIFQYASDLHLSYRGNAGFVRRTLAAAGDVLLLAGDVADIQDPERHAGFWDWCEDNFKLTVFVPGNHDYYGSWKDLNELKRPMRLEIRPNVLCCNNTTVTVGSLDILCSTLWSAILPEQADAAAVSMPDFREILVGGKDFSVEDSVELHQAALSFLKNALETSRASDIVVVTHHLPTYRVVNPKYASINTSSAFASELGDWIEASRIVYWLYGHSHDSIEAMVGGTRLVSNQLGYLKRPEAPHFCPDKSFVLG